MNQIVTEALVLKRLDFKEHDRILTLLTSDQGKVSVIAKGVKKPKSKLAGGIELFSVNNVVYINSKNELKTLVTAHVSKNYSEIVKNIQASLCAYDILKYINLFTESGTDCSDFFWLTNECLSALNQATDQNLVMVWFCVRLLDLSGQGINLQTDSAGNILDGNKSYAFDYSLMAFSQPGGSYNQDHIKLLRLCRQYHIAKIAKVNNTEEVTKVIRILIEQCVKF